MVKKENTKPDRKIYTARWVYAGQRSLSGGKIGHVWWPLSEADTVAEGDPTIFYKNITHASVGHIFIISSDKEDLSSAFTKGENRPRYVEKLKDKALVEKWSIESQIDRTEHERVALLKKEESVILDMTLRELKAKSAAFMPERRRALIAYILFVLRG